MGSSSPGSGYCCPIQRRLSGRAPACSCPVATVTLAQGLSPSARRRTRPHSARRRRPGPGLGRWSPWRLGLPWTRLPQGSDPSSVRVGPGGTAGLALCSPACPSRDPKLGGGKGHHGGAPAFPWLGGREGTAGLGWTGSGPGARLDCGLTNREAPAPPAPRRSHDEPTGAGVSHASRDRGSGCQPRAVAARFPVLGRGHLHSWVQRVRFLFRPVLRRTSSGGAVLVRNTSREPRELGAKESARGHGPDPGRACPPHKAQQTPARPRWPGTLLQSHGARAP